MKCFVDEQEISPDAIGPPAMNFGQHWRYEGAQKCHYRYLMSINEFLGKCGRWFNELRRDEMNEEGVEDNQGFPHLEQFRQLKFPTLPHLIEENASLLADLVRWCDQEVLEQLTEYQKPLPVLYSVNSLDVFAISSGTVEIGGIAYRIDIAPQ